MEFLSVRAALDRIDGPIFMMIDPIVRLGLPHPGITEAVKTADQ
jgi:hypothetical protein